MTKGGQVRLQKNGIQCAPVGWKGEKVETECSPLTLMLTQTHYVHSVASYCVIYMCTEKKRGLSGTNWVPTEQIRTSDFGNTTAREHTEREQSRIASWIIVLCI